MGKALKVTIVEDDKVIQNLTAMRVAKLGHTVHSLFESGESALAQIPQSLPDIVIMDIDLGGDIDGIDVALSLQKQHKIPFVFVSSHRDEETINRVKMVDGAEYIVKPFTDDGLRIAIDLAGEKYQVLCQEGKRQELQEMLLNQFFGAIIAIDSKGVITYINKSARLMTRWKGKIDGMTHFREIVQIVDGKTKTPLENIYEKNLREKKICWLPPNSTLISLDKDLVPVMGNASPLLDSSGNVTGAIVVLFPMSNPMYMEFRGRPLY
ncbi:MAG: response regulator [Methanoregula sp.]|nr:response regulator [Methanoregula sp.]